MSKEKSKCTDYLCVDKPKSFYDRIFSISGIFRKRAHETRFPQRPLFRSEFGSITWSLFHRLCAYYPTAPSQKEKEMAQKMFVGFAEFFPCQECKGDLLEEVKKNKIKVDNNRTLSKWFCEIHNATNKKIGRPEISIDNIDDIMNRFII